MRVARILRGECFASIVNAWAVIVPLMVETGKFSLESESGKALQNATTRALPTAFLQVGAREFIGRCSRRMFGDKALARGGNAELHLCSRDVVFARSCSLGASPREDGND